MEKVSTLCLYQISVEIPLIITLRLHNNNMYIDFRMNKIDKIKFG